MKYFLIDERDTALAKAILEINKRTSSEYTRGYNDCAAFLAIYDGFLRGNESKAWDALKFRWNDTKEFLVKLGQEGYTVTSYLEYCGYEILRRERPIVGDVAFVKGAMIYNGDFWVSPTETNEGIGEVGFDDPRRIHARPIRS